VRRPRGRGRDAISSPLLEASIDGAHGVLLSIQAVPISGCSRSTRPLSWFPTPRRGREHYLRRGHRRPSGRSAGHGDPPASTRAAAPQRDRQRGGIRSSSYSLNGRATQRTAAVPPQRVPPRAMPRSAPRPQVQAPPVTPRPRAAGGIIGSTRPGALALTRRVRPAEQRRVQSRSDCGQRPRGLRRRTAAAAAHVMAPARSWCRAQRAGDGRNGRRSHSGP